MFPDSLVTYLPDYSELGSLSHLNLSETTTVPAMLTKTEVKAPNDALQLRRPISIQPKRERILEKHAVAPLDWKGVLGAAW